jgi:hypothetical protein
MDKLNTLSTTAIRKGLQYSRKLWVRVVLMGLLAVAATVLSQLIEAYIPEKLAKSVSGGAADRLLQLIAVAMLSVTIFSITVMVSVFHSSSAQWTPRVQRLMMQDRTTQNTMAVFLGAYVYALLGTILREMGVYVDDWAFVLFWMTVLVLAVIVIYLIRGCCICKGSASSWTRHDTAGGKSNPRTVSRPSGASMPRWATTDQRSARECADDRGMGKWIPPAYLSRSVECHGGEV